MQSGLSKHSLWASRNNDSITSMIVRSSLLSPGGGTAIAVRISSFLRLYVVGNACLSQLRNHIGDMVVEPVHSIGIFIGITLCLLDVVVLGAEELMLQGPLPLRIHYSVLICYLEILLLAVDLEESLTITVGCPNPVPRMYCVSITLLFSRASKLCSFRFFVTLAQNSFFQQPLNNMSVPCTTIALKAELL
jgi:hypothetical protein